jgi:branched-subunit amino acid ABC-type transport system permease component
MRVLSTVLFAWSLIATWGLTLAGQAFPPDTLRNPLVEYAWPNWQMGNIARNLGMFLHLTSAASLLPLLVGITVLLATLWFLSRREAVTALSPGRGLDVSHLPER